MLAPTLLSIAALALPQKFEDHSIYPPDQSVGAYFAHGVSIDQGVAVVGASQDSTQAIGGGSAYVYEWNDQNNEWDFLQKLLPQDWRAHMKFGMFVWVDGSNERIAVGARGDDPQGPKSGSVYLYKKNSASGLYELEQKLLRWDGAEDQHYGSSVILDGDWAMVGCYKDDDNGHYSGSVYFWKLNQATGVWQMHQKLTAYDGLEGDKFGRYNHLKNGIAVIGASRDDNFGTDSGSAYIYRLDPVDDKFKLEQHVFGSDANNRDRFGISSWVDGDVAIFGAYWDKDPAGSESGSAYIFRRDHNGVWQEEAKISPADGHPEQFFGCYVQIYGDIAYVGAYGDDEVAVNSGAVYVYERDSLGDWNQINKLLSWSGSAEDNSGRFFDSWDGHVIVGNRFNDLMGPDVGAAVEFKAAQMRVVASKINPIAGTKLGLLLEGASSNRQAVLFADIARSGRLFNSNHNVLLDLVNPNRLGSSNLTNGNGEATWSFWTPPTLAGVSVFFQIAENGLKSNRLQVDFN